MGAYQLTGQRARQMRVIPAAVLKKLYARSDAHGLMRTAVHAELLVAGGWLVMATRGSLWLAPAMRSATSARSTVFTSRLRLPQYLQAALRATLNSQARNSARSRTCPALR